ncbi:glutathione S-transferase [Insolitispirillum peregrinum]|uniref:Glutathione S-transferase n=2 Tax=Insolitispirillum peregrinum TaxID=80876 RepID=A0A1N7PJE6_9PROT|nr:glutathione S-transferase [Insolitispirillum peregrinum]
MNETGILGMENISAPIKFYRFEKSGHSHKVQLFLSLLGLPTENIDVDLLGGEQRTPAFLKMNPFGTVPVIQDGAVTVADSHAILVYLALTYADETWYPRDPQQAAQVQRWLSVSAGMLAFGPCAARLITVFGVEFNPQEVIARAHALLSVMEREVSERPFLTGDVPTIADVANYAYVAHAPEGNVSLADYPHVRAWLARIEALPGFVPMPGTAIGLVA